MVSSLVLYGRRDNILRSPVKLYQLNILKYEISLVDQIDYCLLLTSLLHKPLSHFQNIIIAELSVACHKGILHACTCGRIRVAFHRAVPFTMCYLTIANVWPAHETGPESRGQRNTGFIFRARRATQTQLRAAAADLHFSSSDADRLYISCCPGPAPPQPTTDCEAATHTNTSASFHRGGRGYYTSNVSE